MEECACNIILSLNIRGSVGLTQKENLDGPKPSVIMFLIFKVERNGSFQRKKKKKKCGEKWFGFKGSIQILHYQTYNVNDHQISVCAIVHVHS